MRERKRERERVREREREREREKEKERERVRERERERERKSEREMCINSSNSLLLYQTSFFAPNLAIPNNDSKIADRITAAPIYAGIKVNVES